MAIIIGVHYLIWARMVRDTGISGPWKTVASLVIIALGVTIPATIFGSRYLPAEILRYVVYIPYVWLGIMVLLFPILAGTDILRLGAALVGRLSGSGAFLETPERREFIARLIAGGAGLTVLGLTGSGFYKAIREIAVKTVDVALARLPVELSGFTIVQITDLHIGQVRGKAWVESVVEQVNDIEPDLIAITGDLVDGPVEQLRDVVTPLANLRAAKGCFFVTGNHEYFSGYDSWKPVLEGLGIRPLHNERVTIESNGYSFELAGVNDFQADRFHPEHAPDLQRALNGRPEEQEVILLAHQPRAVDEAAEQDVGLVLSGHTHGGQMWPWMHMVGLQQPYLSGLHRHGDRTQIYVSEGTGCWGPPLRIGTHTEITKIRLSAEEST